MLFIKKVVTGNLNQQTTQSDAETELEKYHLMVATQQRLAAEYKQSAAYNVKEENDKLWSHRS